MDSFNSHLQESDNQCNGVLSIHFDFLLLAFVFNSFCQSKKFTFFDIIIVSGALSFEVWERFLTNIDFLVDSPTVSIIVRASHYCFYDS